MRSVNVFILQPRKLRFAKTKSFATTQLIRVGRDKSLPATFCLDDCLKLQAILKILIMRTHIHDTKIHLLLLFCVSSLSVYLCLSLHPHSIHLSDLSYINGKQHIFLLDISACLLRTKHFSYKVTMQLSHLRNLTRVRI